MEYVEEHNEALEETCAELASVLGLEFLGIVPMTTGFVAFWLEEITGQLPANADQVGGAVWRRVNVDISGCEVLG